MSTTPLPTPAPQAGDLWLRVLGDELLEAPCFDASSGARNWLAVVEPDPSAPGGLCRIAVPPTPDGGFLLPGQLERGTVIESGAEATGRGGTRVRCAMRYGVVVRHDEHHLVLHPVAAVGDALDSSAAMRGVRLEPREPAALALAQRRQQAAEARLLEAAARADAVQRLLARLADTGMLGAESSARARAAAAQIAVGARLLRDAGGG